MTRYLISFDDGAMNQRLMQEKLPAAIEFDGWAVVR
jgi:hypothetical protein